MSSFLIRNRAAEPGSVRIHAESVGTPTCRAYTTNRALVYAVVQSRGAALDNHVPQVSTVAARIAASQHCRTADTRPLPCLDLLWRTPPMGQSVRMPKLRSLRKVRGSSGQHALYPSRRVSCCSMCATAFTTSFCRSPQTSPAVTAPYHLQ
jgi:hypothetical protein